MRRSTTRTASRTYATGPCRRSRCRHWPSCSRMASMRRRSTSCNRVSWSTGILSGTSASWRSLPLWGRSARGGFVRLASGSTGSMAAGSCRCGPRSSWPWIVRVSGRSSPSVRICSWPAGDTHMPSGIACWTSRRTSIGTSTMMSTTSRRWLSSLSSRWLHQRTTTDTRASRSSSGCGAHGAHSTSTGSRPSSVSLRGAATRCKPPSVPAARWLFGDGPPRLPKRVSGGMPPAATAGTARGSLRRALVRLPAIAGLDVQKPPLSGWA
mmetsp:Transcript_47989/g.95069  ORF Transcript_47989/g.95069 Transcript_47989/m.95069 type:complete len:267 (+) Transcript_47989:786-1586(+)